MATKTYKKTNKKTTKKDSKVKYTKINRSKFNPTASLSKLQRKYCDCIMKVRSSGQSNKKTNSKLKWTINTPYAICYSTLRKSRGLDKSKKSKKQFYKKLNPQGANCIMSYDTTKYTLHDIQMLAKEKGISITHLKNKKRMPLKKSTLITKITRNYTSKK
jgi:hypothetical protein